jgi:hypothetical protein
MQIKYIMALLCGLLISLGASSQEAEPTVGSDRDDLSKIVKVEKNEALSNLKKVVITSFSVEVLTYLKAGGSGDLGNLISGKPNSVSVNLKGHDIGTWPDMVNQYYGQLVKQLESSGIEVIRPESLQDDADYKTILEAGKPSSHEEDAKAGKGLYFGVDKVPMLIQNEQNVFRGSPFSKPPEDLYMTFGSQFAAGFSTASAQNAEYALARKLDAHALKVRFTVVPTSLTTTKGFLGRGPRVDSKASLSLPTHVNRFVVYSPSGDQGKISLSAPAVGKQTVGRNEGDHQYRWNCAARSGHRGRHCPGLSDRWHWRCPQGGSQRREGLRSERRQRSLQPDAGGRAFGRQSGIRQSAQGSIPIAAAPAL